jgi:hypothetical protein
VVDPRHVEALIKLCKRVGIRLGDKLVESGDALFDRISWQNGLHRSSLMEFVSNGRRVSVEIQTVRSAKLSTRGRPVKKPRLNY